MGFIREKYSNNYGGLVVAFNGTENTENYFSGNNIEDALEYFNMYVKDNQLFIHSDEELALAETGISTMEEAEMLREQLDNIIGLFTDEEAIEHPILFPKWQVGKNYAAGERIRYGSRIFKVLQTHLSQADWTPSRATSLFAEILTSESGEPQEWQQPSSTNPYLTGDKVIFEGNIYESLIDNNVWSPAEYPIGWQLIEPESEPENPDEPEIDEWEQKLYMIGDKVIFEGHIYESIIDNNVWSPSAYPAGWTLIE